MPPALHEPLPCPIVSVVKYVHAGICSAVLGFQGSSGVVVDGGRRLIPSPVIGILCGHDFYHSSPGHAGHPGLTHTWHPPSPRQQATHPYHMHG